ncbi:MAG: hypothetical protein ACLTIG_06075 [Roseburia hominis]
MADPDFFKRCLPGVVLGAVLVMFAGTLQQENFQNEHRLYNKLFTPVFMTQVDGIPVTFVMNLAYMSIEKPQKYSVGEAKEFLKKIRETAGDGGVDRYNPGGRGKRYLG